MMRNFLIYLSKAAWARRLIMALPFARRTALRFVAGETEPEALQAVAELNKAGMLATLDLLGEDTQDAAAAAEACRQIQSLLNGVANSGLKSGVSIKLTQIGLKLDENLCAQNLKAILETARGHGLFVRIDMEDSPCVDATLRLFRLMRTAGCNNVGVVIQSALYRSEGDTAALLAEDARVRLVKGAYMEPPEVAYPKKEGVDAAFDRITELMLKASVTQEVERGKDSAWPPIAALGTHDDKRIEFAKQRASELGLAAHQFEFQMLYGIRRELQRQLLEQGYAVRIYVPFGHHWYPYFMRRLAERPANLWFFISNFFKR